MGNTLTSNDKTVADDAKVKLIIGEIGRDTQTGIIGRGYSFDNGNTFHVTDTIYGRLYTQNDADGLWNNGLHEKVKEKVNQEITNTVEPAIKQADSAVAYANDAIKKSRVNSQAIVDINSAVSDAVSDAAVARSDGLRAWNAAQSNVGLIDSNYASASAAISSARTEAIAAADEAKAAASAAQADFDTKFAGMAGNINALQVDASGMKQTLVSAKGDISTLQATATGFKNTLTDAQGNISTLQSDVSGLKKTTSDHAGNIATLQADAKTLTSQMSSVQGDISTLKQTASGFSSKVSGMETSLANANSKLDGITSNGGGRNLLQGTRDFSGDWLNLGTAFTKTGDTYNGLSVIETNVNWNGVGKFYPVKKGETYTFSLFARYTSGTGSSGIYVMLNNNPENGFTQAWVDNTKGGYSLDTNWKKCRITFTATTDGYIKPRMKRGVSNTNTLQLCGYMLEKGTIAHDWSPAPEDTDAKITTNSTAIEQNKKAIALKADQTTVDKTNGDVQLLQSQLKVQEDQINAKVSSSDLPKLVGGGGRNLLVGTSTASGDVANGNGTIVKGIFNGYDAVKTNGAWTGHYFNQKSALSRNNIAIGDWVTISVYVKADKPVTDGSLDAYRVNGGRLDYIQMSDRPITTEWQQYSWSYQINNDSLNCEDTRIEYSDDTGDNWIYWAGWMLEKGMVSHDWQPAPEDAQTYTQTQIKQTSDSWNANLTSVKNGLTQSYTNLHATVDGIQAQVYNKDGSSKITQLSNLIATKVSQGDYNSQITQLKDDINLRVAKGDVISQINQEAGGNTLIQVSNGKGSLVLDAANTIVTGKAWIPVASIADLTADQIQAGTLTGSTVHLGDSNGNTIDLGVLGTNHVGLHSSAQNGDQTYIDSGGIHNYGSTYDTKISQGKITTNLLAVNGGGLIDFRSSGDGTTIDSQNIKFYNSNAVNGGIEFSGGNPIATVRDGTVGNELRVRYDRSFALTPIKDESARICASSASMQVGFIQSGSSTPDLNTTGLWVDGDKRRVNLGVWGADSTWARVEAKTHNIHMQAGEAHAWLSNDNVFHIYKDNDGGSSTATKLQVDGWAWVKGWVEAAGHSQHSALSTKTNIQPVDDDKMLEMVNDTDLATFLYKTDVASGETHRHIGLIIDDVHDVAKYQTPQDFIAPNGVSRDDDNMIGALFGAVKALTKRVKTLESKVG